MRIKEGYLLRKIADTNIVVPVGERVIDFRGMMVLNDVSAKVWEFLNVDRTRNQVLDYILETYDVDRETALYDINELIEKMENNGVLELC